jgi:hypothetical protein
MKTKKRLLLLWMFIALTSCDYYFGITFHNDLSRDIYIQLGGWQHTISSSLLPLNPCTDDYKIRMHDYIGIFYQLAPSTTWKSLYSDLGIDTMHIFVYDANFVDSLAWTDAREHFLVRYDLSAQDVEYLNNRISYPPTPDMRNMKMFPSYEEVLRNESKYSSKLINQSKK